MSDTPTVTDEMVEAGAAALQGDEGEPLVPDEWFTQQARACIQAALAAQPEGNVCTQQHKGTHQKSGWIVFENTTGLFVGFFFNEDLARRYHARQPQDWTLERWERSNG